MSGGADVLEAEREKFRRYKTETDVDPGAKTTPGISGVSAALLREGPAFLRDVATAVFLLLEETARNRRAIDKLWPSFEKVQQLTEQLQQLSTKLGALSAAGKLEHNNRVALQQLHAETVPALQALRSTLAQLEFRVDNPAGITLPVWLVWGMAGCTLTSLLCTAGCGLFAAAVWWAT